MDPNPYRSPPLPADAPARKLPQSPFRVVMGVLLIVMGGMTGLLCGSMALNSMELSTWSDRQAILYVVAACGGGAVAGLALAYALVRGFFRRGD